MSFSTSQQTKPVTHGSFISSSMGLPDLIILERPEEEANMIQEQMIASGFVAATDYAEILQGLSLGQKVVYTEQGKALDSLVLEIVVEYSAGMVSLADRKGQAGLQTFKFSPHRTALTILMTRSQVEASYPRLYEYVGAVTSSASLV